MKKLIKVILPPFVAFLIFALLRKFNPFSKHIMGLADIGNETIYGLVAYYKIFMPLLYLVAMLTQALIVLPLWRKILSGSKALITIFMLIFLVCCILAAGISYLIWDKTTGTHHLTIIFLFMTAVQLAYWIINLITLLIIE